MLKLLCAGLILGRPVPGATSGLYLAGVYVLRRGVHAGDHAEGRLLRAWHALTGARVKVRWGHRGSYKSRPGRGPHESGILHGSRRTSFPVNMPLCVGTGRYWADVGSIGPGPAQVWHVCRVGAPRPRVNGIPFGD